MTPERMGRIRWRCRRGMLENDLILARYLDAYADTLTETEWAILDRLLDLPDNELWDLLAGRGGPPDAGIAEFVAQLRAA